MMKVVFLVKRRGDLTVEEYRQYSTDVHAPMVTGLPGLRRYVVNYSLALDESQAPAYDGLVELWFESAEAFQSAMASDAGQAAVADQANFLDTGQTVMLVVDEVSLLG
ncbi:MAG: EthD family reductase [Acidobacteria bacterium]|nr:MAG: EthD family reductase [Acidobacteriota bacterium]REK00908.1 MAG: EthD family reductase [Acidobacteriota bacterium]